MGKSMYNFGKQGKEKARQQKQMDKAAKRIMAKQQKTNQKMGTPNVDSDKDDLKGRSSRFFNKTEEAGDENRSSESRRQGGA